MNSRINARYCQILGTVIEVSLCLDIWLRGQSPEWFAANRRDTMHIGNEFMQNTIMIIVEKSTIFPYILIDTADLSQRWINHWQVYWVSHTKMCANNNTFLILWFCIWNEITLHVSRLTNSGGRELTCLIQEPKLAVHKLVWIHTRKVQISRRNENAKRPSRSFCSFSIL